MGNGRYGSRLDKPVTVTILLYGNDCEVRFVSDQCQQLALKLSAIGLPAASLISAEAMADTAGQTRLGSGIRLLDDFFAGGLPLGSIVEWGAPFGQGGRELLVRYLASVTKEHWILWVHARACLTVYPPAWMARGLSLERLRFAVTAEPLEDLRAVFLEPFFRVIVLDAPPMFSKDDCAFVARRARVQRQLIILVRDHQLNASRGNVWARLRVNCWFEPGPSQYRLRVLRGLSPRQLSLREGDLTL